MSFLTICPVPDSIHRDRNAMRSAPGWYPIVGLLLGGIAGAAFVALGFLPPLVRAVMVVAIPVLLTRALHLDGFADVCDGLGVTGPVAKRLEVMRDPRLGTFGVAGVVFNLLLRVSIAASLPDSGWIALVAAPLFGRWALVIALGMAPYSGAGFKALALRPSIVALIVASVLPLALRWLVPFPAIIVPLVVVLTVGWLAFARRAFGSLTGDSLGALNELAELLVLGVCLTLSPNS